MYNPGCISCATCGHSEGCHQRANQAPFVALGDRVGYALDEIVRLGGIATVSPVVRYVHSAQRETRVFERLDDLMVFVGAYLDPGVDGA
jgi:hypothetical protein